MSKLYCLLVITFAFGLVTSRMDALDQCERFTYTHPYLSALCDNDHGVIPTRINLDECLSNSDGNLIYDSHYKGSFSNTCRDCTVTGRAVLTLECTCINGEGKENPTTILLNKVVRFVFRDLEC
jgi:hypothetical protein